MNKHKPLTILRLILWICIFFNICYFLLHIQYFVDIACNVSYFPSLKVKADMIGTPWSGDVDTSKVEEGKIEK